MDCPACATPDKWDHLANVATTFGFVVAGLSALLALLTYRSQLTAAADAHMHGIFREYLTVNLRNDATNANQLETFRLYTLEEMFDWIREQRWELAIWGWLRPFSAWSRWDELDEWAATVTSHLIHDMGGRVRRNAGCYGRRFETFVIDHAPTHAEGQPRRHTPSRA